MRSRLLMSVLVLGLIGSAHPAHAAGARLFVRHEVGAYTTWRQTYDAFDGPRRKMGVKADAVYRSADDANDITITHDFKTAEAAKALLESAELKAAMQKAGVTGEPKAWVTTRIGGSAGEAKGVRLYVRHSVADPVAWRKGYDSFDATRRKLGVVAQAVYASVDDPKDITVTHDFKTLEAAKAFAASPELKTAMEKAGVTNEPQVWFTTRAAK
jgi:hypothetical protein